MHLRIERIGFVIPGHPDGGATLTARKTSQQLEAFLLLRRPRKLFKIYLRSWLLAATSGQIFDTKGHPLSIRLLYTPVGWHLHLLSGHEDSEFPSICQLPYLGGEPASLCLFTVVLLPIFSSRLRLDYCHSSPFWKLSQLEVTVEQGRSRRNPGGYSRHCPDPGAGASRVQDLQGRTKGPV